MRHTILLGAVVGLLSCAHTLEGPCPELDAVYNPGSPDRMALVVATLHSELVVEGKDFEVLPLGLKANEVDVPKAKLELGDERVTVGLSYVSDNQLHLSVPPTDPPMTEGLWDLVVENPNGCTDRLKESVEVRLSAVDDSIVVAEIIPPFGWTEQATAVTIRGDGFASTPRAWLSIGDHARDFELQQVAFIDPNSLSAIVPAELPVGGPYDLIVENPDAGYNLLEDAFTVTAEAPPDIFDISPEAGETQNDTPVVITGENFDPGVRVFLYDIAGTEVEATVDSASATEIQATFPTSGALSVGAWIVRATNEDDTWDEHAAFVVRNPSAKLGTAGSWAESEPLQTPRVGLGLVSHVDDLGRGFLFAVAGSDGSTELDSVERARTDAFGTLGGWETLSTQMITPRAHGGVIHHNGWIYAIGGDDGSGPVDTVERARVLTGTADVRPTITSATQVEGGDLATGTWYYRVSAVMQANDANNPDGETSASASYVVRTSGDEGRIDLAWTAVTGAAHYRVYRTDAPDGASGQEHRIAETVAGTTYTDDGKPAGTASYVPEGALGEWQELPARIPSAWAHGAVVKATDPNGDVFAYLVGGADGAGAVTDVYALDLSDNSWFVAAPMSFPRIDNMAAVAGVTQAQNLGAGSPVFVIALDGDYGGGGGENDVAAPVQAGGTLGAWVGLNRSNSGGQERVDGIGLAAAGHLYILGGGGDATSADNSGRQSEIQGPDMTMGSWSSTSNSGTLVVPRADFGLVQQRATLYSAGGRTDLEVATTSVEQVVF